MSFQGRFGLIEEDESVANSSILSGITSQPNETLEKNGDQMVLNEKPDDAKNETSEYKVNETNPD